MFLFIFFWIFFSNFFTLVSIHPMFLFIEKMQANIPVYTLVSIHPMFLFIVSYLCMFSFHMKFQYIPCSYLSFLADRYYKAKIQFQYIPCSYLSNIIYGKLPYIHKVSIHPMFLFIYNRKKFKF